MEVRGVCYQLGGDVEPKNLSVKFTLISESWQTPPRGLPLDTFPWEEKLVASLIAAPNGEMRKWEDKGTEHKCLTTGYACNCNAKDKRDNNSFLQTNWAKS